ncbi:MAG: DUF1566 domain-containing protein [gamma proteobacterium symbiont of Taylorina sp.]|nr:DUF1566 domain-containing protein [gamma proteobacterium symbiont of Taylorina sp.]
MKIIIIFAIVLFANFAYAGDTFTKISASGAELPDSATEWSCVKQNAGGLIWEVKNNDRGLNDSDDTYNFIETIDFVNLFNAQGLCGFNDWRLPLLSELESLVEVENNPTIDSDFFPLTQTWVAYWSSTTKDQNNGYYILFTNGSSGFIAKDEDLFVRLVRTGQPSNNIQTTAKVQSTTGQSLSITPVAVEIPTASSTVPDTTAILTQKDSTTTLKRDDGSIIEVKPETIVVLNPHVETTNSNTLIRGEITTTVDCTNTNDYEVRTALADIKVPGSCSSTQRAASTAKFTTTYSQDGIDGTLTVKVTSGTVGITDREGKTTTLTAGQNTVIQDIVPRTSWVLPIDNDKLYGGKNNFFIWTEYPDADSYLLEFNIPGSAFSEENPASAEFQQQTVVLTSNFYIKYDGLLIFTLPLPKGFDGVVIEVRLFALDKQGKIIGETVASDRSTVTVTD